MLNLIPEKRLDRNGKLVTRHVKQSNGQNGKVLPPPSVKTPDLQTEQWELRLNTERASHKMEKVFGPLDDEVTISSNDVEAYGMLAVLPMRAAVHAMSSGVRDAGEALALLKEHHIDTIQVDWSKHADDALRRGVPAKAFFEMCESTFIRSFTSDYIIDAAEVFAMDVFSGSHRNLVSSVLEGKTRLSDIKEIGPELIAETLDKDYAQTYLESLKSGKLGVTKDELKKILEWSKFEGNEPRLYIEVASSFGFWRLNGIANIEAASSMSNRIARDFISDPDEGFKRVTHYEEMAIQCGNVRSDGVGWRSIPYALALAGYDAGLTPVESLESWMENISPLQYKAIKEGIESSVSSGWL